MLVHFVELKAFFTYSGSSGCVPQLIGLLQPHQSLLNQCWFGELLNQISAVSYILREQWPDNDFKLVTSMSSQHFKNSEKCKHIETEVRLILANVRIPVFSPPLWKNQGRADISLIVIIGEVGRVYTIFSIVVSSF